MRHNAYFQEFVVFNFATNVREFKVRHRKMLERNPTQRRCLHIQQGEEATSRSVIANKLYDAEHWWQVIYTFTGCLYELRFRWFCALELQRHLVEFPTLSCIGLGFVSGRVLNKPPLPALSTNGKLNIGTMLAQLAHCIFMTSRSFLALCRHNSRPTLRKLNDNMCANS